MAAIKAASGLAVLVSSAAFQSDWVAKELKHALKLQAERDRQAFPVILLVLNVTNRALWRAVSMKNPSTSLSAVPPVVQP